MTNRPASARARALNIAVIAICAAALVAPTGAGAAGNPWTTPANQFLNMAHQGGELEAPGNTLYAFKTALKDRGADAVEMDAYITSDGELVVSHDLDVDDTTDFGETTAEPPFNNPAVSKRIWDYTLAQLQTLDAGYRFSPGKGEYSYNPTDPHPFRGVATGEVDPPAGYTANDFRLPTFKEVLNELPAGTKINIDIKDQSVDVNAARGIEAAHELAQILQAQPGGDNENVMVASFGSEQIEAFHDAMPTHDSISGSLPATQGYVLSNPYEPFEPEIQAIQPPDKYDLGGGFVVDAPEIIRPVVDSRGDDYAIHVWGADATVENDALFTRMVAAKVQGYFPQESTKLAAFLCANHVPDATGTPRCSPPATPIGPIGSLGKAEAKGKAKAGRKVKVNGSITNSGDQAMTNVRACINIPKKLRKVLKAKCVTVGDVAPGATAAFTIKVKSTNKAKGKYKLALEVTSDNGGMQTGTVTLKYTAKKGKTGSAK